MKTKAQKISLSLPLPLFLFIEKYKEKNNTNRSKVVEEAIVLLEKITLEEEYAESSKIHKEEIEELDDFSFDGLTNEAW